MIVLYNVLISFFSACLWLVYPFLVRAYPAWKERLRWRQSFRLDSQFGHRPIWVHCASVGEFEDVRTLLDLIRDEGKQQVVLTFQSPSAFNKIKHYDGVISIHYMPLDTWINAKNFVDLINPSVVVFSRSEFWLNYLIRLKMKSVPVYVHGFRITNSNIYFLPVVRSFYKLCFSGVTTFFCEDMASVSGLQRAFPGIDAIHIGNPRLDRIIQVVEMVRDDLRFIQVQRSSPIVVLGSIEPSDFDMVLPLIARVKTKVHWIVTPHHVDEDTLRRVESMIAAPSRRFSALNVNEPLPNIVIVDSIGMLSQLYRGAQAAIVGGGFSPKGIHSMLESVLHGVPTACGPNHRNYSDVLELLDRRCIFLYHNAPELEQWIERTLDGEFSHVPTVARGYIIERGGASSKAYKRIMDDLRTSAPN